MQNQRYGFFEFYYPSSIWNLRRFTGRRLKTLHIIGFYNALVLAFLTFFKHSFQSDHPILVFSICAISFCIALVGFAVEIPRFSGYFERLESKLKNEARIGRHHHRSIHELPFGHHLPIHRPGLAFYILLMILWLCIFVSAF